MMGVVDRTDVSTVNGALPTCILEETHPFSNIWTGEGPIGGSKIMPRAVKTLGGEKLEAKVDASLVLENGSETKFEDACLPSPSVGIDEGKSDHSLVKCPVESSASFEKVQGHITEINDAENALQGSGNVPEFEAVGNLLK
ncbi:hypothetical protein NL676_009301 [Syzygium grande]|nr:hypothetical protein NL676_009301 [Syzygium grande]